MVDIYIISDLHIGGELPQAGRPRGFRLCTNTSLLAQFVNELADVKDRAIELVINGDMVDFLAERDFDSFTEDPQKAVGKLKAIIERDEVFFLALRNLLKNGHKLTILPGNHDIELLMPQVRRYFEDFIGAYNGRYLFIPDGEAYTIGKEVIIEHGNHYDDWNRVDFEGLHRLRQYLSRNEPTQGKVNFSPPKGSALVTNIINKIKEQYQFIDLLKPENEAMLPILLALEPNLRSHILTVMQYYFGLKSTNDRNAKTATTDKVNERGIFSAAANDEDNDMNSAQKELDNELEKMLGSEDSRKEFERETPETLLMQSSGTKERGIRETWAWASGLFKLFIAKESEHIDTRLHALWRALRVLQQDQSFDPTVETLADYQKAAEKLSKNGFKYIVFGHTHFARRVQLPPPYDNAIYFNAGTWADLMQFPKEIIAENYEIALPQLRDFVSNLMKNNLKIYFKPTYVRISMDSSRQYVTSADLFDYTHTQGSV